MRERGRERERERGREGERERERLVGVVGVRAVEIQMPFHSTLAFGGKACLSIREHDHEGNQATRKGTSL